MYYVISLSTQLFPSAQSQVFKFLMNEIKLTTGDFLKNILKFQRKYSCSVLVDKDFFLMLQDLVNGSDVYCANNNNDKVKHF